MTGFADGLLESFHHAGESSLRLLGPSQVLRADPYPQPPQISQLLASINGEKSSATAALPPAHLPKRKPDDDVSASNSKIRRTTTPTSSSNAPIRPAADPPKTLRPAERASTGYAGSARPSSSTSAARPMTDKYAASAPKKPALASNGKPSPTSASFVSAGKSGSYSTSLPEKRPTSNTRPPPAVTSQPANPDAGKAHKKGSIAEIKARAAAQQEKLQAIGKIQHKATEKPLTKKERDEAAAELRLQKKGLKPGVKPGTGFLAKTGSNGLQRSGNGHIDRERGAIQKASTSGRPGRPAPVEEPKRKKAALATTGYTGSARTVAGKAKPSASKPSAPDRGRDQDRDRRPNPMGMFSQPRRRREDDYDEEMDDFVVDDEEEEEDAYASRYRYADEDDDSDMEAGFSDVEDEEAAATRLAILDDKKEQELEERHRREKEARKHRLLAGRR